MKSLVCLFHNALRKEKYVISIHRKVPMHSMNKIVLLISLLSTFIVFFCSVQPPPCKTTVAVFSTWPDGCSPREIGKRVADRFIATPHSAISKSSTITYPETCTWFGALQFAEVTKDKKLLQQLIDRFQPLFDSTKYMVPVPDHVDYSVFGSVPLELYIYTKEKKYLDLGIQIADKQWGRPEGTRVTLQSQLFYERGLTWQTRLWIDDNVYDYSIANPSLSFNW